MTRAVLSLGSNLGDRLGHLRAAVAGFADALVAASPVYETAPWGGVEQDDFLNAVLLVDDPATDAWGWLRRGQALEEASGRVREVRWGPRTLDVDVLLLGDVEMESERLTLPHPQVTSRRFVLVPLLELDPGLALPDGTALARALSSLEGQAVHRAGPPLEIGP